MTKLASLVSSVLLTAALAAPAAAEAPLTTTVFTAGPGGFLVTSTLIAGEKEAVLVDAQFSLAEAHRLVAQILESKKTLTAVYVTHDHPDHYFGLEVIKQAFPKAKLVVLPATAAGIKKGAAAKAKYWGAVFGAVIPTRPLIPTGTKATTLTVDGQTVEIHAGVQGDSAGPSSYVWIPSTKTVIAGDLVYAGVHPWTAETTPAQRTAWIKSLDEITALAPTTVVPGHSDAKAKNDLSAVKFTKDYLVAFDAAVAGSKTSAEVQTKIKAAFKGLQLDVILQTGADAQFARPATPAAKVP